MSAGLFVGHHDGPGFFGIEVRSFGIEESRRRRAKQARNYALAKNALLRVAAVRMKAVADDGLALTNHVRMNGEGRNRHLREADKCIADGRANGNDGVANFSDSHLSTKGPRASTKTRRFPAR